VTNSKPVQMSTANIITLSRVPLLICVVILLYLPWAWARFVALVLLPILYLMDWFDGYVARYKDQVSDLGSVLDIAIDRVVENVLWIVFAHQYRVPVWIPILFIIRSFVIDGLRSYALSRGHSAFGMMHSKLGSFLVASRFMRGLYGLAKGAAFVGLALGSTLSVMGKEVLDQFASVIWAEQALVYLAAILCILRGLPVLWDIRTILGSSPQNES
jgi:CDP-diacylglycerol--glycerol-3-phosphate 3-phosphatidyltransferase